MTLHAAVSEFPRRVDVLPWAVTTAPRYGMQRNAKGRTLAPMDGLISSHFLRIDAILVTNDLAFEQLPGLSIEDRTTEPQ